MDNKIFKILSYLKEYGVGIPKNISPLLVEMFPVDVTDRFSVNMGSTHSVNLMELMKKAQMISFSRFPALGSGNSSTRYSWFDIMEFEVSLTPLGMELIDKELNKDSDQRLKDLMMESTQSTWDVNKATIDNIGFQKKAQKWSIGIAGVSVLFIAVTIILSILDKTPQRLLDIQTTMKTQDTSLQNIRTSLEDLKSAIERKEIDTIFVRTLKP